jgi:hypothetical protein
MMVKLRSSWAFAVTFVAGGFAYGCMPANMDDDDESSDQALDSPEEQRESRGERTDADASSASVKVSDLPWIKCHYGYRPDGESTAPPDSVLLRASDARAAVSVLSGVIGSTERGFLITYANCMASDGTGRAVTLSDLPKFTCNYGYDNGETTELRRSPIEVHAADARVATSVVSGLIGGAQLGFPLNYVECQASDRSAGAVGLSDLSMMFKCDDGTAQPYYFRSTDARFAASVVGVLTVAGRGFTARDGSTCASARRAD